MGPIALSPQNVIQTVLGYIKPAYIPDLTGKVAVVSGFNSGIGYNTTKALLEHGAEVIGICRSEERGYEAEKELKTHIPGAKLTVKLCNMELLSNVSSLAQELLSSGSPIHLLINNAGRFLDETFTVTKEGIEHTMALDYYGHATLTLLLLNRMMESGSGRIVNVISPAEAFGAIDWADMKCVKRQSSGMPAYGRAKLMLLMFTFELQRRLRLAGAQVEAFAVHPGVVNTRLLNKTTFKYPFAAMTYYMSMFMGQTDEQGSQSTLYAATHPDLSGHGGQYIGPSYTLNMFHNQPRKALNPTAYDVDAWLRLWEETEGIVEEITQKPLSRVLPPVGTRV